MIEILPFDSIYDLKQLIEDRIYRKNEREGLICDMMREKATIDYNSAMGTAERKGIEEGGRKDKIDLAKNLLDILDDKTIAEKAD